MDIDNKYGNLELQKYYLPILNIIDQLCRKNGIKYTLSDGSLIGAIRHGGFIPWDDDIDISLDRKNYNKLIDILETDLPDDYTVVYDIWVRRITRKDNPQKKSIPPGGCIDLLVFDNVPDGKIQNFLKNIILKMLQGMMKREIKYSEFSFVYKFVLFSTHWMGKLFTQSRKQKWYQFVSQWGNKRDTKCLARYCCSYRYISGVRYNRNILDDYIDIEFENKKYMALKEYHEFLTTDFGDYMKLPPEADRVSKHKH